MSKIDFRDHETELAIAAAVVLTAGVAIALLMGRQRQHPLQARMKRARKRVMRAGEHGLDRARGLGESAVKSARRGVGRGMDLLEDIPIDDIGDHIHDYLESAREAIEDTVRGELKDLQKSIRRRRRRLGI